MKYFDGSIEFAALQSVWERGFVRSVAAGIEHWRDGCGEI
jgi:hypothetical protein